MNKKPKKLPPALLTTHYISVLLLLILLRLRRVRVAQVAIRVHAVGDVAIAISRGIGRIGGGRGGVRVYKIYIYRVRKYITKYVISYICI